MTAHAHCEFVNGCYRCDLSRDEVSGVEVVEATPEEWAVIQRKLDADDAAHALVHQRESIARAIEAAAQYEGVRAQRVIRMCAAIARAGR